MRRVLCTFIEMLAVTWIGTVTGLAILYQLVICRHSLSASQFVVVCCLVLPAFLLTAPVHELGHALAAWWTRHTIMVFSVYGLALHRADLSSPWRLGRTPLRHPAHGVVAMVRDGIALRHRHLIFILGGVTMNCVVAVVSLLFGQAIFSPFDGVARFHSGFAGDIALLSPNTPLIAALNLLAIANICDIFHCLVLSKPGASPSDGTQLRHVLREPHVERDIAVSNLKLWIIFGVRPRNWEPTLVNKLQVPGSVESELPAAHYLYWHRLDCSQAAVAERRFFPDGTYVMVRDCMPDVRPAEIESQVECWFRTIVDATHEMPNTPSDTPKPTPN